MAASLTAALAACTPHGEEKAGPQIDTAAEVEHAVVEVLIPVAESEPSDPSKPAPEIVPCDDPPRPVVRRKGGRRRSEKSGIGFDRL